MACWRLLVWTNTITTAATTPLIIPIQSSSNATQPSLNPLSPYATTPNTSHPRRHRTRQPER